MSPHSHISDYSRYFSLRQKVCLVNMSAERNDEVYESLSGVVTSSGMDSLELMITHGGNSAYEEEVGKATFKLTSEALGSGIQVLADLIGIVAGTISGSACTARWRCSSAVSSLALSSQLHSSTCAEISRSHFSKKSGSGSWTVCATTASCRGLSCGKPA
jgi:hypothetical protein